MTKQTPNFELEEQMVAFFGLVFAAAHSDGFMSNDEIMQIFGLMDLEKMSDETQNKIRSYIVEPPDIDECFAVLRDSSSNTKYMLAVNIMTVLLADNEISETEEVFLNEVYSKLGIKKEQRTAIENFVKVSKETSDGKEDEGRFKKAISDLEASGIPKGVLIGCGIGVAAGLGIDIFRYVKVGKFIPYGAGIALLIGAIVLVSCKLFGSKAAKEKQRLAAEERKSQLVIKNLINSINTLKTKMNYNDKDDQGKQEQIDELINRLNRMHEINKNKQTKDK